MTKVFDSVQALSAANSGLSLVQLCLRGERVYVRGRKFPPKPGHVRTRQYEIPLGFKLNARTIKTATAKAQRIESDLITGHFAWGDWLKKHKKAETCAEWIAKFEQDYWDRKGRTATRENSYKKFYGRFFGRLTPEAELTIEELCRAAKTYPPESHGRHQCCSSLGTLARFAGLSTVDLRKLGEGYTKRKQSPPPCDAEIERLILNCENRQAQWIAGIAATFGLRNHEILSAHLERIDEGLLMVDPNTKTGERLVVAHPFSWVALFKLTEKPKITLSLEGCNNRVGARVGACLKRNKLPRCYEFRKAYGLRLRASKQIADVRARFMGHSAEVHERDYMDVTTEAHLLELYKQFKGD